MQQSHQENLMGDAANIVQFMDGHGVTLKFIALSCKATP